jgi:hypothetical protein
MSRSYRTAVHRHERRCAGDESSKVDDCAMLDKVAGSGSSSVVRKRLFRTFERGFKIFARLCFPNRMLARSERTRGLLG